MSAPYTADAFTPEERGVLSRYVTDVEGPVFALVGLPEVTCAALFARYSRSAKTLRRLLLDEFLSGDDGQPPAASVAGRVRASDLFARILAPFGRRLVDRPAAGHSAFL